MSEEIFLRGVVEHFGKDKQMVVCIEEMAELTQQLSKFIIGHKNKQRDALVEEYSDVLMMLNQVKIIFNISDGEVLEHYVSKINRLKKYMKEYN